MANKSNEAKRESAEAAAGSWNFLYLMCCLLRCKPTLKSLSVMFRALSMFCQSGQRPTVRPMSERGRRRRPVMGPISGPSPPRIRTPFVERSAGDLTLSQYQQAQTRGPFQCSLEHCPRAVVAGSAPSDRSTSRRHLDTCRRFNLAPERESTDVWSAFVVAAESLSSPLERCNRHWGQLDPLAGHKHGLLKNTSLERGSSRPEPLRNGVSSHGPGRASVVWAWRGETELALAPLGLLARKNRFVLEFRIL